MRRRDTPVPLPGAPEPHRTHGGAGRERPASRGRQALDTNHRRGPAETRRGGAHRALARSPDDLVSRRRRRTGREHAERRSLRVTPLPGRGRSCRRAVPRRVSVGRRPVRRALRRRSPREGERDTASAGRREPPRRARERAAAPASPLPERTPFPRGLSRARDGRPLAAGRSVRAVDRDRSRAERRRAGRRPRRDTGRARRQGEPNELRDRARDAADGRPERGLGARRRDGRVRDRASRQRTEGAAPPRPRPQGGSRSLRRHDRHVGLELAAAVVALSQRHPHRPRHERGADRHGPVHAGPGDAVRRPHLARVRARAHPAGPGNTLSTGIRIGVLVLLAAVVQVTVITGIRVLGAEPDLLLVTIVCVALVAGSLPGAIAGFAGGLVVDVMTLGTLGTTSIVLTLAGYWAGRYGETTGRGRAYAPPLAAFAISLLAGIGGVALHFLIGQPVSAREALVVAVPSAVLSALLALGVHRLCRAFLAVPDRLEGARQVEI